jgi:hypothetical protein
MDVGTIIKVTLFAPSYKEFSGKIIEKDTNKIVLLNAQGGTIKIPIAVLNEAIVEVMSESSNGVIVETPPPIYPNQIAPPRVVESFPAQAADINSYEVSEDYSEFEERLANRAIALPYEHLLKDFIIKRANIHDDEDTRQIDKHLQSLYSKYKDSLKLTEREQKERFVSIQKTLLSLQANYYFDDDIRLNIVFISWQLKDWQTAIKSLKQAGSLESKPRLCYLLGALLIQDNDYVAASYYLCEYLKNVETNFDERDSDFLVWVLILRKTRAFKFLQDLFYAAFDDKEGENEFKICATVYATAYLLRAEGLHIDASKLLTDFEKNAWDAVEESMNQASKMLNERQDKHVENVVAKLDRTISRHNIIANAEIETYYVANEYGLIRFTDEQNKVFMAEFVIADVADNELRKQLKNFVEHKRIQIFCGVTEHPKSPVVKKAVAVMLPNQNVDFVLEMAKVHLKNREFRYAEAIVAQILRGMPLNKEAKDLDIAIKADRIAFEKSFKPEPVFIPIYVNKYNRNNTTSTPCYWEQAKHVELKEKNLEKSIPLYRKAIENRHNKNEKGESAVKDLAMVLQRSGKADEAISLLEDNISWLENEVAALNLLAMIYTADKQYIKAVEPLRRLLAMTARNKNLKIYEIRQRLAYNYFKARDYGEAKMHLTKALQDNRNDAVSKRLLEILNVAESTGDYTEAERIFGNENFTNLRSGFSNILKLALEKCNYRGLRPVTIAKQSFTRSDLEELRGLIRKGGTSRPQERAEWLLTEAKLLESVEPENNSERNAVLARYCNAAGQYVISEDYHPDISRSYFLEAFTLETEWDSLVNQVGIFLQTFFKNSTEITLNIRKTLSVEETIKILFDKPNIELKMVWDNILQMFIVSQTITASLLPQIFKNEKVRQSAIDYLNQCKIGVKTDIGENDFINKWNEAREKRKNEMESWLASFRNLSTTTNIQSFLSFIDNAMKEAKTTWLSRTDNQRLESIRNTVVQPLRQYTQQSTFDEKERILGNTLITIQKLVEDFELKPTQLSFDGYILMLQNVEQLLKSDFEVVTNASTPRLSLKILGEFGFNDQNQVTIQVAISNERQCSPVNDISLTIVNDENCALVGKAAAYLEPLKGGEEKILSITVRLSYNVIREQTTDIKLKCAYKTRNQNDEPTIANFSQNLKLYNESEFDEIDNRFAPLANGKAVEDSSMFFGRDMFIKNIADSIMNADTTKCVVIYGQKRSGKSSVLYHLKERLSKEAFCINFSLGEILEGLSNVSFFYKILSNIEDTLDNLRFLGLEGVNIPVYKCPDFTELQVNPSIIFSESLKKFKKECQKYDEWRTKKLVLLIDEFTYLYSAIQRGSLSEDFLKTWKALLEKNIFSTVLVGQDVMPKFKSKYANEFGTSEDKRLTYLNIEDAKRLIEEPIWDDKRGRSRYVGKAVEEIIDYTASHPFYIQIFCSRLVEHLNANKDMLVTQVSVNEVAKSFIVGNQAFGEDKFDNLLTAGDADLELTPVKDTLEVLRQIAQSSRNLRNCSREAINVFSKERDDLIIEDLLKRDVLSVEEGNYRIQVKLFKEWLLNR